MKHDKKNSKIIPFPNVKERLVHKGMAALKEKNYHEALRLFSEAKRYDDEESDIYLGMAICLLEIGELEEAKGICEKNAERRPRPLFYRFTSLYDDFNPAQTIRKSKRND